MGISVLLTGVRGTPDCQRVMKHVNIRYIKLDRRMLDGSAENLKELISLAHELKIKVIAPQVEDPRSIAQLWSSDADFVQGQLCAAPGKQSELRLQRNQCSTNLDSCRPRLATWLDSSPTGN